MTTKFKTTPKHIKIYSLDDYKKLNNICGVYTFLDKNKKVIYIGSSCNIGQRIRQHIYDKKSNKRLSKAWENNKITHTGLLRKCKNTLEALQKEDYYIERWPNPLLNGSCVLKINSGDFSDRFIKRFWTKVETKENNECWLWNGYIDKQYGRISYNKKMYLAHRISFILANPSIKLGAGIIRHKCDNKSCVNPNHLEIGSQQDNMRDKSNVKKYKGFGEEKYLTEWFEDKRRHPDITLARIYERISKGYNIEKAITESLHHMYKLTALGETKTHKEWEKDNRCSVKSLAIYRRLKRGMSPEDAITKPAGTRQ